MIEYPPEICGDCARALAGHWLEYFLAYCHHARVIVVRERRTGTFKVIPNIRPREASRRIATVGNVIRRVAKMEGVSVAAFDQFAQRAYEKTQPPGLRARGLLAER